MQIERRGAQQHKVLLVIESEIFCAESIKICKNLGNKIRIASRQNRALHWRLGTAEAEHAWEPLLSIHLEYISWEIVSIMMMVRTGMAMVMKMMIR